LQTLIYLAGFALICLASHRIGQWFARLRLPYITGYLFTGVLVGSFGLQLLPSSAGERLRFIDQIALAVYCLDAGNGQLIWKYPTEGAIVSTPMIVNGVVYIGSMDHHLYALKA